MFLVSDLSQASGRPLWCSPSQACKSLTLYACRIVLRTLSSTSGLGNNSRVRGISSSRLRAGSRAVEYRMEF